MKDLSLHILDILTNSVEASASIVELQIKEDLVKDILSIRILDNGKGMDNDVVSKVCSPFYTTRYTRKIGLGLSLLKMKAEECEGFLKLESYKNKGTKVYTEFKNSHWDKPPLGDIASTICCFLAWEEQVNIVYTHFYNDNKFNFDSRLLEKEIAPIPINNLKIMTWIKDFINSGIKELRKKRSVK